MGAQVVVAVCAHVKPVEHMAGCLQRLGETAFAFAKLRFRFETLRNVARHRVKRLFPVPLAGRDMRIDRDHRAVGRQKRDLAAGPAPSHLFGERFLGFLAALRRIEHRDR